ncbi:MAG: ATP synthase F1 subunit epsilon [Acidobacteria bacterium]|nr:MAG: ATP synthase F1 subunit epsilon [Acidobacteriota bacterium]
MLKLEIVTPERRVIETETESVTVPTASGEAGILTNHAPLISALKPGILTYAGKGGTEKLAISSGFVEVSSNQVSVLTDVAETAEEVDAAGAKTDREEAEKELAARSTAAAEENDAIRERLELANARLSLAGGR